MPDLTWTGALIAYAAITFGAYLLIPVLTVAALAVVGIAGVLAGLFGVGDQQ